MSQFIINQCALEAMSPLPRLLTEQGFDLNQPVAEYAKVEDGVKLLQYTQGMDAPDGWTLIGKRQFCVLQEAPTNGV